MTPRTLFRTFSFAELVTWTGLIAALILRVVGSVDVVPIAGGVHGFVFLCYVATAVFVWVNEKWKPRLGVTGVVLAVIPFATLPFEIWLDRRKLLSNSWRLAPGEAAPRGFVEHVQAWVLRHPVVAALAILLFVTAAFVVLLILGPPVPLSR